MAILTSFKTTMNHFLNRLVLLSLILISVVAAGYSQKLYSQFDHLTTDNGLSSNRIWCIFRDSKDFLWMGTDVGLDRYDSYSVKNYRHEDNQPGTVSTNTILCIYEDRAKNLWIGTNNGLNLYDPEKDNFKIFKNSPEDKGSLNSDYIATIAEDDKGKLWILTDGNCLNKWVPETHSFIRYQFEEKYNRLWARPSKMISFDSKGNLWIVSLNNGINCFNPESGKFIKFIDPSIEMGNNCFKSLYIDKQDKIWIKTDGNGFFSYDPVTNKFEQFGSKGDGKGTNRKIIMPIIPEDDNHLLLGVDQGGINRFDKISKTFEYFMYNNSNDEGLNNNGIWCFHRDREGILWVGTSGGGINYINPRDNKFDLYKHTTDPNSLSYSFTGCFFEDHEGMIWIGTDGGGVNVFDPVKGAFSKLFKHVPSDPYSISGDVIRCITEDRDHNIWIATWDAGLNRYDRKTNRFYRYMPDKNNPSSISGRSVWNIKMDHNGYLWLGNYAVGTDLFDVKKGVIRRFRSDKNDPNSISSDQPYFFYEDSEKNMWICTENGLNLYNEKTNSFKVFNFPGNQIEAVLRDKDGDLWVGSNTKGVFYCKPDGSIIKTFNVANGLANNKVQAILEDNKGNLWISTSGGISRLDRKTQKFRNYSKEDGLQSNQFFQQSFLKTAKGEIYFGGYNGFNSFYPDSLKDNDFIPPVYITDFQIFNKPVAFGVPGSQFQTHINEAKEITLNWRQSVFSFSFAAINYTFPEKNQYSYMMEGFEKDWNYTNAFRRYVTYTNLDPGEYIFKVKSSNNDGIGNEKGASLRIIILPPWWGTLWFRLIMISTIIFILVFTFLSRVRHLKNQKMLLEKLVAIKTTELKELNASKDKFFSIIAHDLRGPLSAFVGVTQILTEDILIMEKEEIIDISLSMKTSATNIYNLLENLLEWSRLMQGKMDFVPEKFNLRKKIEACIVVLSEYALKKRIEIAIIIPDEMEAFADNHMFDAVIRNLVSNAIKFTSVGGKVSVFAEYCKSDHSIEVEIVDSGIGITPELKEKLFLLNEKTGREGTEGEPSTGLGLLLCKEFIEKHGGKIWVESESGIGSIFKFNLPLEMPHSA